MTLQPRAPRPININVARIIWFALTLSMVFYTVVLIFLGKINGLWVPESQSTFEQLSLAANVTLLITFFVHQKFVVSQKDLTKKFPYMILCWALHESVLLVAFATTFITTTGNGFFLAINLTMALFANLLTYPKSNT